MGFNIITESNHYSLFPILKYLIEPNLCNFRISLLNDLFSPAGIDSSEPNKNKVDMLSTKFEILESMKFLKFWEEVKLRITLLDHHYGFKHNFSPKNLKLNPRPQKLINHLTSSNWTFQNRWDRRFFYLILETLNVNLCQSYQEFSIQEGSNYQKSTHLLVSGITPNIFETQTKHENTKEKGKKVISHFKGNSHETGHYILFQVK